MAGISQVLSIAKEALLAHQLSVQVTAHNIANVDTPGFTRQALALKANTAALGAAGMIGGGVRGDQIHREYDQFMTQRLVSQKSLLGDLEAQQGALRLIETVFNEAPGLALNDLMSKFWSNWHDLSSSPENFATRQTAVQGGQLLAGHLTTMNTEIARAKNDIGINLDVAITDVNALTAQLANINVQIATTEGPRVSANDLRDRRDQLVKELSALLDINYFENKIGSYSVLLADGHPLVEAGDAWQVDWADNKLHWVNTNIDGEETRRELGTGAELGGKIGGWLEARGHLVAGQPDNFLGRLDAFAGGLIREFNQQHSQGVGLVRFSDSVIGTETADNTAVLTTLVDSVTASKNIAAGSITINDLAIGGISGGAAQNGLAMVKTANAVTAINKSANGVSARLTTLVAGDAVTGVPLPPANHNEIISFDINGVNLSYTIDNDGIGSDDSDCSTFAANLVAAINNAITIHNNQPTTPIDLTLQAVMGDGTNGGVVDSIILKNINAGDESQITIENISAPAGIAANLGLTEGSYRADATHNTGEITLFSDALFTVQAGVDDRVLDQLGMGGGVHSGDIAGNGRFSYSYVNGGVSAALHGYEFADILATDNGNFDIWLYNKDNTLALPQAVTVSLTRAYTLQDVASAINTSIANAGGSSSWLTATVDQNRLRFDAGDGKSFTFANDYSNFLQVAGVNTFFSGHSAGTIGINSAVSENLSLIAAGIVTDNGEVFKGDNSNALLITNIQNKNDITFIGTNITTSLDGFYNGLVGEVGNLLRTINREHEFNSLVTNQMQAMRDATAGVSLDEEIANLMKFQHAFTAASRLISISDEMLVTLLEAVR